MSSPSTDSRRRRRADEEDASSEVNSEDAVDEQPNKRRRYDTQEQSDEEDEDEDEGPLLPDNYRRSPKGKQRARDATLLESGGPSRQEHQPGSIVRVKLTDFVTYSSAEFHPGPNLNMVIGPNGTGKSTLVCAICIGLGWGTHHLGRAKDITEFVKHGKKSAEIEIELKADPERHEENQVITHIINKDNKSGSKSVFKINGRRSNNKEVQTLAKSFSIQVDNLCQFLPQDRVVEFAALSPVDLLVQTQRAAAPEFMSTWHDDLKRMGKEHRVKQTEQQKCIDDLKRAEDRQRAQEDLVTRLRERHALQENVRIMEKMKPFAIYQDKRTQCAEAKERKRAAAAELGRLERNMQPNIDAVNNKKAYYDQLNSHVEAETRMMTRLETQTTLKKKAIDDTAAQIEECQKKIDGQKTARQSAKQAISSCTNTIRQLRNALRNPPEDFDPSEMNEEIRRLREQVRSYENDKSDVRTTIRSLQEQAGQRQTMIEQNESKKAHLQSQAGKQTSKLQSRSRDAARAWEWIQSNRNMFDGDIYGPPMVECSVKDPAHIDVVESVIGTGDLLAFTATNQRDFKMLKTQLHDRLNLPGISLRSVSVPLSGFRPPCSDDEMRRLGGERWIVDLIDGPDAVLAMLCDNQGIHAAAFAPRDLSDSQFDAVKRSDIPTMATPHKMYKVTKRREYGDAGISTRITDIRKATHLGDVPIDTQEEQDISRENIRLNGEVGEIKQEIAGCQNRWKELEAKRLQVEAERKRVEEQKNEKQSQKAQFDALQPKIEKAETKLQQNRDIIQAQGAERMALADKWDEHVLKKGQQAIDYAIHLDAVRKRHVSIFEAEIMRIEAKSDLEQLESRHREEMTLLTQTQEEVSQLRRKEKQLVAEGKDLERKCQELSDSWTDEEAEYHRSKNGIFTVEQLQNDIEQVQAQLESLHGGNDGLIKEFEDRARYIERKRTQLGEIEHNVNELSSQIDDIRERWEPRLDEVVGQISEAFAENFARIHCAGEVAVHKDDDFEQWAIEIRVKFRENEQLSVLDAHRQSGGERAVSTIFYLMALQSLARAPFRVVDEINQGMDPRNERLVHSRMVEIACAEHTSQYFLITPKLLNNLTYHKNMKVHCIASGEYMPSDHRELDFGMLAKKALAIKAGGAF